MKYKVLMAPSFFVVVIIGMIILSFIGKLIPWHYQWIYYLVYLVIMAYLAWEFWYTIWRNRTLSIEKKSLVFPKYTIKAGDISQLVISKRSTYFMIYFKHKKIAVSVTFNREHKDRLLTQLKKWAQKNRVLIRE